MTLPNLHSLSVLGKRVLVRVDFNVPTSDGRVSDDTRIRSHLPTIHNLTANQGKVILMSHLGRPKGKRDPKYSLEPVGVKLQELLGDPWEVVFSEDCLSDANSSLAMNLKKNQILLLENVRFYAEEEKNDREFSRKLASCADLYVNDAFGSAHRAHGSTVGVIEFFGKGKVAAGLLLEKEVQVLSKLLENPKRPFLALLGGAKVSDKLKVIHSLLKRADRIVIGGAMAYTFLKASGFEVGKSLIEPDLVETAKNLMDEAKSRGKGLFLPVDHVVASSIDATQSTSTTTSNESIPSHLMGLDIGPKTIELFTRLINESSTVLWNGPMGVFEKPAFSNGTLSLARRIAEKTARGHLESIAGGGDSLAAIAQSGTEKSYTHLSTGGGASLEFLEGKPLPGVTALEKA